MYLSPRIYIFFVIGNIAGPDGMLDFELKKVLLPQGNFSDISYLEENFKPHLLRDVCTLCSGA